MEQINKFCDYVKERLIFHQENYKRKKEEKGEEFSISKMHKAINQRKEMKQLNRIWSKILSLQFEGCRQKLINFELKNSVFVIGGGQNRA